MNTRTNRDTLTSYLTYINEHDVQMALDHLAEDFRLVFKNGPTIDKFDLENALGWDTGTNGRLDWHIAAEHTNSIAVEGHETNDFLALLHIEPLVFASQFYFNDINLINRQTHNVDWTGISVTESLAPVVEWARRNAFDDLEIASPGGKMVYSEDCGRNWVNLLRRWTDSNS